MIDQILFKEVIETLEKLREDLANQFDKSNGNISGIELIEKVCFDILKSDPLNKILRNRLMICDEKYCTVLSLWNFIEEKWFVFKGKEIPHHIDPEDTTINGKFNEAAKKLIEEGLTLNNWLKYLYDYTNRKIYGFVEYGDNYENSSIVEKYVSDGNSLESVKPQSINNKDQRYKDYYETTKEYIKAHFMKPSSPYGFQLLFTSLKGISKKSTGFGGIFSIYTDKALSIEVIPILDVLAEMIFDLFTNIFYQEQNKRIKRYSIQSAIAAIMSRNMSHNIGSHILSTLGYEGMSAADDRILFRYLQQRMDYIALISTETTKWTYSAWFINDIMKWLYKQKNLLDYIARSEGLKSHYWKKNAEERAKEETIVIKIRNSTTKGEEKFIIPPETENENALKDDFQIAIPGGIAGLHAFYTILENIIRNSAKHDWSKKKEGNLEITIDFNNDPEKSYVLFTISDNISDIYKAPKSSKPLLDTKMNKILTEPFIDAVGELQKQNWGLGEMRISAGYLNKKDYIDIGLGGQNILLEESKDNETNGFIKATSVYDNNDNSHKAYRLAYQFIIPKPKEVLIIGNWIRDIGIEINEENEEEAKKSGVYFKEKQDSERDYNFVLLHEDAIETLLKKEGEDSESIFSKLDHFTARILVVTSKNRTADKKLEKRIMYIDSDIISNVLNIEGAEKWEILTLLLYRAWVHNICRYKVTGELKVYVQLQGKSDRESEESEEIEVKFKEYLSTDKILKIAKKVYIFVHSKIKNNTCRVILRNFIESKISERVIEILDKKRLVLPPDEEVLSYVALEFINNKKEEKLSSELKERFENDRDNIVRTKNEFEVLFEISMLNSRELFNDLIVGNEDTIESLPGILSSKKAKRCDKIFADLYPQNDNYLKNVSDGNDDEFNIIYARHLENTTGNAFYSESLSGSQTYFTILSTYLSNVGNVFLSQKIAVGLLENALLRILIVDERVMRFCQKNKNAKERYRWMNIEVPIAVCWKKYYGISYLSNTTEFNDLKKIIEGRDRSKIEFFYRTDNVDTPFVGKSLEKFDEDRNKGIDILIIHQGILDKMNFESSDGNNNAEKYIEFIEELKKIIPFVFVTSGRGKPANLPQNAKFLPFSVIETFLMKEYPEKYLLAQSLMQIFREVNCEILFDNDL